MSIGEDANSMVEKPASSNMNRHMHVLSHLIGASAYVSKRAFSAAKEAALSKSVREDVNSLAKEAAASRSVREDDGDLRGGVANQAQSSVRLASRPRPRQ